MQPDIIPIQGYGCGSFLLEFMEKIGNSNVQLLMSKAQYNYIQEHMKQTSKNNWVRK